MSDVTPVCLVAGVGPGTGAAVARRFAKGGYRVALVARNAKRLDELGAAIPASRAFVADLSDPAQARDVGERVGQELGPVEVLVHNAPYGIFGEFHEITPERFERAFRTNAVSLLALAQAVTPAMIERGRGAVIVTGNTSARRGKANFAGFAPTKAAQRILAESMARALGPRGVHVAYVVVDAVIDVPWTREAFADRPDEFFAQPDAIAETIYFLAHQERSAWSFEVDLRPFGEAW
jgi:NAD(P)-dependent dehydrogenase (short-subunit alcohol dehydrogenase family)